MENIQQQPKIKDISVKSNLVVKKETLQEQLQKRATASKKHTKIPSSIQREVLINTSNQTVELSKLPESKVSYDIVANKSLDNISNVQDCSIERVPEKNGFIEINTENIVQIQTSNIANLLLSEKNTLLPFNKIQAQNSSSKKSVKTNFKDSKNVDTDEQNYNLTTFNNPISIDQCPDGKVIDKENSSYSPTLDIVDDNKHLVGIEQLNYEKFPSHEISPIHDHRGGFTDTPIRKPSIGSMDLEEFSFMINF